MSKDFIEIGICGLSCRVCPSYHTETKSKCGGCKSEYRLGAPCPFHNCALKRKKVDFCVFCPENDDCERWHKHRYAGKEHDSIVSYQKLEDNIAFIQKNGLEDFEKQQMAREALLKAILAEFNEGRSKTLYCIAATVLEIKELEEIFEKARTKSKGLDVKAKSKVMHSLLNGIAEKKHYLLKLRK